MIQEEKNRQTNQTSSTTARDELRRIANDDTYWK